MGTKEKQGGDQPWEPEWGADGWPRMLDEQAELDEGDLLGLQANLRRTPLERLQALEQFANGLEVLRRARRVPAD